MSAPNVGGYAPIQIALHWTIAALVLFQLIFGQSMQTVRSAAPGTAIDSTDALLATAHYWVGLAILSLVAVRLVIRLRHGAPRPLSGHPALMRAATITHWLFYAMLFAAPITGLLIVYAGPGFEAPHRLLRVAFIGLIALHAAAALFHHLVLRDATLKRMLIPARPR